MIIDMFQVIDRLNLDQGRRDKICFGNAEKLMKTTFG